MPPTPQQARLSITTKRAGALVALAGEEIGRTPLVDYPVAPGHHSVRLQLPGHAPWEGSVAAVAGETVRIDRRMRAVSAVVKVRSQPPAARVLLDGAALEAPTPTTLADVRPGERTLRVELAYHAPWTKSVRLAAGRTYEFDATLKPEKGSLRVESEPAGALVWLDGRAVGATPLELDSVSAGPRTVALTADRFAKKVATVLVEAGRGAELKASLDLQKGSLQAVSTPEGAAIRVDGTLVGTTPAKGIALTPGRHVVRLSAKEHREFQQEIEVEPGGSHVVEANLQPLEGELLVRTEVADAAVFVDGAEVGLTPLDPIRLAPGRHRLTVDRNWHSPWSAWVHVNDAATTEVAAAPPGRRLAWSLAGGAALLGAGAGLAAVGWADARGDQSDAQDDYDAEAAKGIGDQSPETLDRLGADVDAAYDRKTRWSGVASIAGTLAVAAAAWSVYEFLSTGPVEADPVVAGPRPGPDSPRTQLSLTW